MFPIFFVISVGTTYLRGETWETVYGGSLWKSFAISAVRMWWEGGDAKHKKPRCDKVLGKMYCWSKEDGGLEKCRSYSTVESGKKEGTIHEKEGDEMEGRRMEVTN